MSNPDPSRAALADELAQFPFRLDLRKHALVGDGMQVIDADDRLVMMICPDRLGRYDHASPIVDALNEALRAPLPPTLNSGAAERENQWRELEGRNPLPRALEGGAVACQARDKRWNSSLWHEVPVERFNHNPDFEYRWLYAALPPVPGNEGRETLAGQINAIYGSLDAEDCAWIDREWAKMRGYILPTDGTSTISRSYRQTPDQNQKTRCGNCNLLEPCDDMHCPNGGSGA